MNKILKIRWQLVFYDLLIFVSVNIFLLVLSGTRISVKGTLIEALVSMLFIFVFRIVSNVYGQIWRYGGIQCYIKLIFSDFLAGLVYAAIEKLFFVEHIAIARMIAIVCVNLLGSIVIRMFYRYAFKCGNNHSVLGRILLFLLRIFAGNKIVEQREEDTTKTWVAIIGAGRVGTSLAEELQSNRSAEYIPQCFIDCDKNKIGREVLGIPVIANDDKVFTKLKSLGIKEVIFAVSSAKDEDKKEIYEKYKKEGYRIKVYDYPTMHIAGEKRRIREFDIEELLFRKPIVVNDERIRNYYNGKVILITGGGGSIGSELCRQLAKLYPKQIIILDIYENGAYEVQQELLIGYKDALDVRIEILSITNRKALERVFSAYKPNIVINAAAHKHVPLMEHNCIEAVENNVFGTKNILDLCEEYGTERFMMVSTDKAVNPTNVMGATKRLCEMMTLASARKGKVKCTATRFGNVLGSAGSVIPLFKKQIANGGPVTLTDKRIIRFFMTIPEAAQLVLASGAMAKNGELFVLDMGQPVRILELAENMIKLSGVHGIEIVETGLRPGEKLYEEILVNTDNLEKTDNKLIFIEHDEQYSFEDISNKLDLLEEACNTGYDEGVKEALMKVVPTFRSPELINDKI